jgi:Cu(I)/Ag(I) efflux system membrane fusion protein
MADDPIRQRIAHPDNGPAPSNEGGLRAPPGLGFWGKAWWWFHFLILVKVARLRFVVILAAIGLVIVNWDTLNQVYDQWTRSAVDEHAAGSGWEYTCPMHPTVIRDNAREKCPICFMPLSRRKKGDAKEEALPPGIVNRIQLTPYRVVLAGIKTWSVEYVPLSREVTTVGFVEFDEREVRQVSARVKGRIEKLFASETGVMVDDRKELASLYSPDLVETVQNLINARKGKDDALLKIARKRLELWGIRKEQIDAIETAGKAEPYLKIYSPIGGHVVKKYVKEGQYVEEGAPLYDIADLSHVWIQAQVYEEDMALFPYYHTPLKADEARQKGVAVRATTRAFPGKTFEGHVTFIYPHVDQDTRTVIVRCELPNPGHKLRPGTSATVRFTVAPRRVEVLRTTLAESWARVSTAEAAARVLSGGLTPGFGVTPVLAAGHTALLYSGQVLAVPETAVIDTGNQRIVYREVAPGEYEGVLVELGPRMVGPDEASYYPVLRGLAPGDLIVTAGSFLIDAETRLNPAAGSIYFGGSGSKSGPSAVSNVRPSTPADMDAKVKAALARLSAEDRRLAEAQGTCPVLKDSRLGSMGVPVKLMLNKQPVFLCCEGCVAKARKNPGQTLARVEELKAKVKSGKPQPPPQMSEAEKTIKANLAKLIVADRIVAERQKLCPVTMKPLGAMGPPTKLVIEGEPVLFCCDACHPETPAEKAEMLKLARELKTRNGSSSK